MGGFTTSEANSHFSMPCRIKIIDLIQGKSPTGNTIHAYIDIVSDHPAFPRKGNKGVFFCTPIETSRSIT